MGCMDSRNDYTASQEERALRKAIAVTEELRTGEMDTGLFNSRGWEEGRRNVGDLGTLESDLCAWFTSADAPQISALSLEAQMWWRDHQAMDEKRIQRESDENSDKKELAILLNDRLSKNDIQLLKRYFHGSLKLDDAGKSI